MSIAPKLSAVLFACCLCQSANAQLAPSRPDETGTVGTAHTHHILVRSEAEAARLRAEIEAVPPARQLSKFKEVAKISSIDPGSSPSGGSLGTVYRGEMVARFENAIFGGSAKSVTGPFQSEFGWHLAYVERFGEEPVSTICQASAKKAYDQASASAKQGLSLAISPVERSALPASVEPLLGVGWHGPLMDEERNLLYVRAARQPAADSVQVLTRHIEFTSAQLVVTSKRPFGCARSRQEEWAIDCQRATIAPLSVAEYEGRGAHGRKLTDIKFDHLKAGNPIGASGAARQFFDFSCKSSSLVR